MMQIEDRLFNAELNQVPADLDHSVEKLLRWAESEEPRERPRFHWLLATVACGLGILIGVGISPKMPGPEPTPHPAAATVVVVEPTAALDRFVQARSQRVKQGFFERTHGELETLVAPPSNNNRSSDSL